MKILAVTLKHTYKACNGTCLSTIPPRCLYISNPSDWPPARSQPRTSRLPPVIWIVTLAVGPRMSTRYEAAACVLAVHDVQYAMYSTVRDGVSSGPHQQLAGALDGGGALARHGEHGRGHAPRLARRAGSQTTVMHLCCDAWRTARAR